MKNPFVTMYSDHVQTVCEPGNEYDKTYSFTIDKDGKKALINDGKTNRYEKVQSYAEECEIETIIKKASLDPSTLRPGAFYADCTQMPHDLATMQNMVIKVTREFEQLPLEVRAKFDHSVEKYINEYGSENWCNTMGIKKEKEINEEIKEVKKEENENVIE